MQCDKLGILQKASGACKTTLNQCHKYQQ